MAFTPLAWISVAISFSLQLICFIKLRRPASLRVLMLILCAGNVLSVLTRGNAVLYWDQLWLVRILAVLVFMWATADVISLPGKAQFSLRLPILCGILLAVPYWPLRPENGPVEMETYRFFGLCLAVFIVVLHLALSMLASPRPSLTLTLWLLSCVAIEAAVSGALLLGWAPRLQMVSWWAAVGFLSWAAIKTSERRKQEITLAATVPLKA